MVMVVKNGANFPPTYYPTWEDMNTFNAYEYGTKQKLKYAYPEQTCFMVQPPAEFVKLFDIKRPILSATLKDEHFSKPLKMSIEPMAAHLGFYDPVIQRYPVRGTRNAVLALLRKLKITGDYDWKFYYDRTRLSTLKPNIYYPDSYYSFSDEVYKRHPSLPSGWCLNRCPNLLKDIYKDQEYYGITTSTSFFSDSNTGSCMHYDPYGLGVCCFNLPGGADKIWCTIHSKYEDRLIDIIKDDERFSMCTGPFNHNDIILDYQLLDQLDFPYWIAKHKPGTYLFLLPNVLHQVANTGVGVMETINFIDDRWDVESHRKHVFCCDERKKYYKEALWTPLNEYYRQSEREMNEQWTQFANPADHSVMKPEKRISKKTMAITNESNDRGTFVQEFVELVATSSVGTVAVEDSETNEAEHEITSPSITDQIYDSTFNVSNGEQRTMDIEISQQRSMDIEISGITPTKSAAVDELLPGMLLSNENEPICNMPVPLDTVGVEEAPASKMILRKREELTPGTIKKLHESERKREKRKLAAKRRKQNGKKKAIKKKYVRRAKDPYLKSIENSIYYQRTRQRILLKDIEKHRQRIEEISPEAYKKEMDRLETLCALRGNAAAKDEQRRDIFNALSKTFGPELVKKKQLQGYITYEIARDFINGESLNDRVLFLDTMKNVNSKHLSFWKEATASSENWNRVFGIGRERIPARYRSSV